MRNWGIGGVLVVALAAYGCDTANGGPIGEGGSGGSAGAGGMGGSAGAGGMGGSAGAGGMGGSAGAGGMGGSAGAGGMGGSAGAGGMGGSAGAGGMGGSAGAGGMGGSGGMPPAATSCLDLNDGMNADDEYMIEVNGNPLTVYCDMTTDGGGWTQLYDQDVAVGYLSTAEWASGVNTTPPNQGQYSILDLIDEFEGASTGFEFFIDWPNDGSDFVRWQQSLNPFTGRGAVSGIIQSPTGQVGCGPFGGLAAEFDGLSTLDGDTNNCWWWAIGTSAPYRSVGIPAHFDSDAGGEQLVATRTRLWVR